MNSDDLFLASLKTKCLISCFESAVIGRWFPCRIFQDALLNSTGRVIFLPGKVKQSVLKPFSFGFSSHSEIETFPKDKGPLVEPGISPSLLPERMLDAAFFQLRSFGASKFSVMEMSSIHPYIILTRKLFCFVNPLRPSPRHRATFLSDTKL